MLNDLSGQTRAYLFGQMLGFGLMFGSVLAVSPDRLRLVVALLVLGFLVAVGSAVAFTLRIRRADRALRAEVGRGSGEIVAGRVPAVPVPARVVRRRVARRSPAFVVGRGEPLPAPALVVVATALAPAPGAARRVAALVPADLGLHLRAGGPVPLVLHPDLPDVAVLDPVATPDRLAAIEADPRWRTEPLPTDRSVVGGCLPVAAAAVLGLVAGLGVDAAVVALAG